MTARANSLPWPSIDQLPRVICAQINRHFVVAESAAIFIQRWWRLQKGTSDKPLPLGARESFGGGYGGRLHSKLLKDPVFSSEKLDGTNVGKMRDGTLLGRRQEIEPTATTYQRCPVAPLRECDTNACLDELRTSLGTDESKLRRYALYGELCCNPGLYNYTARKLGKSWQIFGAIFHFTDEDAAALAVARGSANGFQCVSDRQAPTTVLVANSPTFSALLAKHDLLAIRAESSASLCELVAHKKAWMTSESGEGLVLTIGGARPKSYKWKISREPQSGAIQALGDLRKEMSPGGDKARLASLLAPAVHTLLGDLFEVATHVDSLAAKENAQENNKAAAKGGKLLEAAAVQAAIASACTKFDAFDSEFAAHGQAAVPKLAEMIAAEVLADKDLIPEGKSAKEMAQAGKEVGALVKRFVGEQFGSWRAQQRAQG